MDSLSINDGMACIVSIISLWYKEPSLRRFFWRRFYCFTYKSIHRKANWYYKKLFTKFNLKKKQRGLKQFIRDKDRQFSNIKFEKGPKRSQCYGIVTKKDGIYIKQVIAISDSGGSTTFIIVKKG